MTEEEKKKADQLIENVALLQRRQNDWEKEGKDWVKTSDYQSTMEDLKTETQKQIDEKEEKANAKFEEMDENIKEIIKSLKHMNRTPYGGDEKYEKSEKEKAWQRMLKYTAMIMPNKKNARTRTVKPEMIPNDNEFKMICGCEPEEKAMTTDVLARTGSLVPPEEFINEIIDQAVVEVSPVAKFARTLRTSSNSVYVPAITAHGVGSWTAQSQTRTEDETFTTGAETVNLHERYALYKVNHELLEDAYFNLNTVLKDEYTLAFSKLEGTAFIEGSGIGEPEGLLTNASVSYTAGGHASLLNNADYLKKIYYDLKADYRRNAIFIGESATLYALSILEDGEGNYLIRPVTDSHDRLVLMGKPIEAMEDMPTIAANAYPLIFGDIRAAYTILRKVGPDSDVMIVDPYTSKTTGVVEFMLYGRVGGAVTNPEAFRKLKIATS